MKEFLSVRGIEFESVNVLEDGGMDKLRALGARSIPIVARDGKFVFAQVIKDVVDFLVADAENGIWLDTPILTVGDRSVRFPARLIEGQRLVCRDQSTWQVFNADDTKATSGQLADPFPALSPGTNRARLDFREQATPDFRIVVKTVKVYP